MHSPERAGLLAACIAALTACATAGPAASGPCAAGQQVMFECALARGTAALCADVEANAITALRFRRRVPEEADVRFLAQAGNGQIFSATVGPLAPGASIRQVWFAQGDTTYLMSQCVGGSCPQTARFSVLRGGQIVSNEACRTDDGLRTAFPRTLIHFGNEASASSSNTSLLQIDDVDMGIGRLYPMP